MKKLFLLSLFAFVNLYAQTDTDKMNFTAVIQNRNSDTLFLSAKGFKKVLLANAQGEFKDTFSVTTGLYELSDGTEYGQLFLKGGYDLNMTVNAKDFDKTLAFTGKGSRENNYLAKMATEEIDTVFNMEKAKKDAYIYMSMDNDLKKAFERKSEEHAEEASKRRKQKEELKKLNGTQSPDFAYVNFKGGTTKLKKFKGKYVYIDVWATWCEPCRQQIPALQKVEERYKDKKIAFVSISVDKKKDYEKWKKLVKDEALGGVQLIADNAWKSEFVVAYGINSIPRFILIGPDGKIVDVDAPRPSDPKLIELLDTLLK